MSEPFPPPPPPAPEPPPGYQAYTATNWGGGLKRIGGLAKALMILLVIVALGQLWAIISAGRIADISDEFLDSQRTSRDLDNFNRDILAANAPALLAGAAGFAVLVLSVIWLYRLTANHRRLQRTVQWGPAWAIAGWVLPPLLFIIPLLMLREAFKAASAHPPGSGAWRSEPEHPLPWIWFVAYSIVPIAFLIAGASSQFGSFGRSGTSAARYYADNQGLILTQGIVGAAGAVVWGLLVRELTKRHMALTGEATAR